MSWRPEVQLSTEGDRWLANGLRFATKDEALGFAADLHRRWTLVVAHRATKSPDPVSHKWENNQLMVRDDMFHVYVPTDIDMAWAKHVVRIINDGGTLIYPATGLIYTLHHERKLMVLQNPEITIEQFDSFVTHQQTVAVFACIGWNVVELTGGRRQ